MTLFQLWAALALVTLLGLAHFLGKSAGRGPFGILIDGRGRYSLTHFQVVVWTLLILSALLGTFVSGGFDAGSARLSPELLGLLGISAGSAMLASGAKGAKDASGAMIARCDPLGDPPKLSQIFLEEEGRLADQIVSVSKFQAFIFTLVAVGVLTALIIRQGGLPDLLPENFLWLVGISQAGYIGGKIPNRA